MGGGLCGTAAATFALLFDTCSGLVCLRALAACLFARLMLLLFLFALPFFPTNIWQIFLAQHRVRLSLNTDT